jgi:hypothetical protein
MKAADGDKEQSGLEPFRLAPNRLCSLLCRIFDGEPDPLQNAF